MATIKLGSTKNTNALLKYAEKRSEVSCGVNCDVEYVRSQMAATREIWGKNGGVQAHHVVQSFKPGEVTPELANQIGQELAKEIAKNHEVAIYTHTDKDHIHNHIVINSVNLETGKKYVDNAKNLYFIREQSDKLCEQHDLSVVKEPSAKQRYHQAEYGLAKRGEVIWKDELRQTIDYVKERTTNLEDFKKLLQQKFGVEVKERGQHFSFKHPNVGRFVRGKTLGLDYERGTIANEFSRQIESSEERGVNETYTRVAKEPGGKSEVNGSTERIHQRTDGQGHQYENGNEQRIDGDAENKRENTEGDAFDFRKAKSALEREQRSSTEDFGKWKEPDGNKQSTNSVLSPKHSKQPKRTNGRNQERHGTRDSQHEHKSTKKITKSRGTEQSINIER
ncbi:Relaxase/Mobilisation nuclease domain-containing protein [Bacillus sp. 491mf]|uniref:relaxase/mobilization nuclease domain-containing protein n=1 Tax=Bacillus sp. 491mf TaxID=1761755 RepID=UPI0008E23F39|nr:relaxase/mobilization nuclease domain-containing protein [Bacillus sp. 491mf]SFD70132.1 Relaxase/Mobilisation nuclease domain-containing protein [Bacillus sp. 491mf]